MMSDNDREGLAWPDHDTGPMPRHPFERPRDEDRATRKPMDTWDRVKLLLLFGGGFLVLVWADMARFWGLMSFREAFRDTSVTNRWLLILLTLELVRQSHYLVSEVSAPYHAFWTKRFFPGIERRLGHMNDWNRYRLA